MNRALSCALLLPVLSAPALAGTVQVEYRGAVLSNSISAGAFANVMPGDVAVITFDVTTPGIEISPGQYTNYAIEIPSFKFDIAGASVGVDSDLGPPQLGFQNDFPVADGLRIFDTSLDELNYVFTLELGNSDGTAFGTNDITMEAGTYPASVWNGSQTWNVFGGGFMEILFETVTIFPEMGGAVTPVCPGDGSGGMCGCGNDGAPGSGTGCANSTGTGALLTWNGTPALTSDTFVLRAQNVLPLQPGLFFQGDDTLNGGMGIPFGDGIRCCGNNVVRLVTIQPDASGCAASDESCGTAVGQFPGPISQNPANPGLQAGDTKCYQFWYRDPSPSAPCGSTFNLTNALEVVWQP